MMKTPILISKQNSFQIKNLFRKRLHFTDQQKEKTTYLMNY